MLRSNTRPSGKKPPGCHVAWFGAAVRTEPAVWIDARNFASQLPDWKQEDRDTLAEVLGAWQANPPTWP